MASLVLRSVSQKLSQKLSVLAGCLSFVFVFVIILLIYFQSHICFHRQNTAFFLSMENVEWGHLSKYEKFGRLGDDDLSCVPIDYHYQSKSIVDQYKQYTHAAHGMLYSKDKAILWNLYKTRGAVLMQVRFDGVFGFPGGLIEREENPDEGLNREMVEELGLDLSQNKFTWNHHVQSFLHAKKKLILHFFMMEITMEEFHSLETNSLAAKEFGVEVFGIVRVPLFTMGDGLRGLPAFLSNHFAGNARQELLLGLRLAELLSAEELNTAVESSNQFMTQLALKTVGI